jgi:hypothetical protein
LLHRQYWSVMTRLYFIVNVLFSERLKISSYYFRSIL